MLVKYEFLKILRKKSTLIIMTVSLSLTGFLFGLPIMQYQIYNQEGVIKGTEGIAYEKKQYAKQSVPLSDEYVAETIREVQRLFENPDNIGYDGDEQFLIGDAYWNTVAPREKLLNLIANAYSDPDDIRGYNDLPDLDIEDGAAFYKAMRGKVKTLLNDPSRALSDEQKEYWGNMADQVETPLQYGYYGGWEIIISSFELLMFALFAICIFWRISGRNRCSDSIGKVWKNKAYNSKNSSLAFIWNGCIYPSYHCGVRSGADRVRDGWI